ncbi:MAG: LuxR C-terminal-related transcriptional regulator [Dehalococcoidia bacterium]|nr:LuxR C-terminal-related transcriptional regulator [Dehalococcoidia bacterium]
MPVLTGRQLEIAQLVAEGSNNRDIANRLIISGNTVKYHLSEIYRVLGVQSRASLTRALLQDGILRKNRPNG